jgi:glycosyltransferase involved in cell wall biosynthesis
MNKYVIITPAQDEEAFIEKTIRSMISQTVLPAKWVVVNDGSADRTGEIVKRYADRFGFIQLVNLPRDPQRDFARKVMAFDRGLAEVQDMDFDFIGNVDADMSFEPPYFEHVLREFEKDPRLGISGGIVYTKFTRKFASYDHTLDSVGGKVQLFRRACFTDIGGYQPLKFGGEDATAEIMARMKGWRVRKSVDNPTYEHRPTGFAYGNPLVTKMCEGHRFYSLGYDPIFYLLRCLYRLKDYPLVLGSGAAWLGYLNSLLRRQPVAQSSEVVAYLRSEQRAKLKRMFWPGARAAAPAGFGAAPSATETPDRNV